MAVPTWQACACGVGAVCLTPVVIRLIWTVLSVHMEARVRAYVRS